MKLTDQQRARIREKARNRDGNGAYLRPTKGRYWYGKILPDGTNLWIVKIRP
jgi:hypothetical protein